MPRQTAQDSETPRPAPRGGAVLVTGGAGFIGSHLVRRLLEDDVRVTIVDDLSTGRRANLAEWLDTPDTRVELIASPLTEALTGGLAGRGPFDEIYHLAAAVGVDYVMNDPIRAIEVNVELASPLLRWATDHGGPPVFFASSSEVYGKPAGELFREDDDLAYGPTVTRRWSYALGKALDEHLALAYHDAGKCPTVVARFFNTVGPRQLGTHGMVLPRFVRSALAGEPLRVFGDGSQSRCFCDVRDVVDAVPKLLRTPACHGRVFNLGSDTPVTIRELANTVRGAVGSNAPVELVPYESAYPKGYEDLRQRRPDLSRVKAAIGFEPKIRLATTIADLADDIRSADAAPEEVSR